MFTLPPFEAKSRQLPILEDILFQRWSWLAERLSWTGIAFAVLLAFAGGFGGSGLLFGETRAQGGDLTVIYEPIVRRQAPAELRIETSASRVTFGPGFEDYFDILSITPPPENVNHDSGVIYIFAPVAPARRQHIVLTYKPKMAGWFDDEIAAGAADGIRFRQFAYP